MELRLQKSKIKIKRLLTLFILCVAIFAVLTAQVPNKAESAKVIGVKIYDYSGDFEELFDEWSQLGINSVFVSPSLDSISSFREQALKHNIKRFPCDQLLPVQKP